MNETDQEKSMDKKEIAKEEEREQEEQEREKMLNVENTKHTGSNVPATLDSEEPKPKKKIPIGGIKMPGFCRTRSKEPCFKDDDSKPTETDETTESKEATATGGGGGGGGGGDGDGGGGDNNPTSEKTTAAKDAKEKEARRGLLNAIRLPLVSVFRNKNKESDAELGNTGPAGLASVETLDDAAAPTAGEKNNGIPNEDGMETVRLDGDMGNDAISGPTKQHPLIIFLTAARKNLFVTLATLCILLLIIIIISVALAGPRRPFDDQQSLRDGKYKEALTSCGKVEGVAEDSSFAFRGIPYAVPPIENRRWQPAEQLRRIEQCWNGTYLAHNSSEVCWQRDSSGFYGSEDCLYLDVFTPKISYSSPLPVVVLIGAETLSGGSPGAMQPSAKLARVRDVVFVRPNFRLGIFGFLAAEPLSRATHPPSSGNYGLSDILAALHWVKVNIEHFGGDKKSVTLWGHRAGGTLVTTLVGIRKSKDLFSQVWISGGSAIFPGRELKESERLNEEIFNKIQCADVACLRKMRPEALMEAVPENWYIGYNTGLPEPREAISDKHEWLVLDGNIMQEHVGQVWTKGDHLPVKIIMGASARSAVLPPSLNVTQQNKQQEALQVEKIVQESLIGTEGLVSEVFEHYNKTYIDLATMISDIRVVCPLLTLARATQDVSFYIATRLRNLTDPDSDAAAILGTYNASIPEEKRHVSALQQLFNYFIWHGKVSQADPKGIKRVLIVDQDILPVVGYPNCDFWINKQIVPRYGRVD